MQVRRLSLDAVTYPSLARYSSARLNVGYSTSTPVSFAAKFTLH